MADSLVFCGTMRAHTDWVTAIATPIDNSDMIETSSREKLLNHKYDPLLEMRSFKGCKDFVVVIPENSQETTAHWPNFRGPPFSVDIPSIKIVTSVIPLEDTDIGELEDGIPGLDSSTMPEIQVQTEVDTSLVSSNFKYRGLGLEVLIQKDVLGRFEILCLSGSYLLPDIGALNNRTIVLTYQYAVQEDATQQLPTDVSQVYPHSVVHGYICNIIDTGCFVHFIGRLTGFAPKNKVIDDQRFDLSEVFFVGQVVRSNIL
ncbi:hypothetical protein Lser_V15G22741 [Lactuca serriola]